MPSTPATILASEARHITSSATGREYLITISLPLGYAKPADEEWPFDTTPAQWPTLYVLDGNWYAGAVTGIVRPMAWCGSTTDAIVIGIGYPEDADPIEAFWDSFVRRGLDLTPIPDKDEEITIKGRHERPCPSGDGMNFLRFIKDELAPMIEREFRADPTRRMLVGHSYGGLFGLLAMYEAPDLFSTLIMGSPTMSYSKRYIVQREEAYAKENKKLPARVFLFAGDLEEDIKDTTLTDTLRLAATLQGRNYEGFSLTKHIFPDQNHCEVAVAGFQWGLMHALRKPKA
jgi:predicted alpha/beta superfamily hydrolase